MSESSVDRQTQFERLSSRNVRLFIEVLQNLKLNQTSLVETTYLNAASYFLETAQFLDSLKIINFHEDEIHRGPNYTEALVALKKGKDQFFEYLIRLTLQSKSLYAKELTAFITKFEPNDKGGLVLPRLAPDEYSYAVRNFLIEADALELNYHTGLCTLGGYLEKIYPKTRHCIGISPIEFENAQSGQTELGLLAEKEVVAYEKSRAGDLFKHFVIHIAKFNVAAGFDVHSVRSKDGKISQWRYIEVKAVSLVDWRFYWTKNERKVAEQYRKTYFLYLVPIVGKMFSMDQLIIIPDPINYLMNNRSEWEISTDIIECRKSK